LLPTAALTALGTSFYAMAADVWMPVTVTGNFAQFGAFGIALSFVTFFTGMAFVIVIGAVIGPVLAEADDPVGRWLRGHAATPLEPSAPPPQAGPDRPVRLADAFGRGGPRVGGRPSSPGRVAGEVVPPDPLTGLQPPDLVQHVPPDSGPRIFPDRGMDHRYRHGPSLARMGDVA
jgi:hypothetical protein